MSTLNKGITELNYEMNDMHDRDIMLEDDDDDHDNDGDDDDKVNACLSTSFFLL